MSLVVKLEDDLGERSEWVVLHGVVPAASHADFLLREWDRAKDRAHDDTQLQAWQKVKHMAETCRHDRDLYLRFVGN